MDLDQREDLMKRDVLLLATAGASLLNGMPFSPVLFPFIVLLQPFVSGTILANTIVLTYLASIMASAMTLAVAGIPAALYERSKGQTKSSPTSLGIWLAGTLALVFVPILVV